MARRLNTILKNYRMFLFRVVLSKLEKNTHNLDMLVNHTEEDDLYKYIFEDNRDIKKVIPRGCTKEFMEVLQHLLYHYEEDQEYEKCQKICDFIDQWEM
tara:strand:+ start:42 stop:338 length:297 start_codon:yes stop_codon:yes gene_type:complete